MSTRLVLSDAIANRLSKTDQLLSQRAEPPTTERERDAACADAITELKMLNLCREHAALHEMAELDARIERWSELLVALSAADAIKR